MNKIRKEIQKRIRIKKENKQILVQEGHITLPRFLELLKEFS